MNWFLIYLISVADGVSTGACILGALAALGALVAQLTATGLSGDAAAHEGDRYGREAKAQAEGAARFVRVLFPAALVLLPLGLLTPSTDAMLKAYLMVEGSKIVNAKNAETTTKEIVKRVDRLIDAITGDQTETKDGGK